MSTKTQIVNDKVIGYGEITKDVVKRPYTDAIRYRPGQRVDIAHYALSVDRTIAYYRVANTLDWLVEDTVRPNTELASMVASTKSKLPTNTVIQTASTKAGSNKLMSVPKLTKETTTDKILKTKQQAASNKKQHKVASISRNKGKTGMDKTQLRVALNSLTPGQVVGFKFVGGKIDFKDETFKSGDFTVLKVRNGRGKGGSRLVELRPGKGEAKKNDRCLITGTPNSDSILNVTVGDTMYGFKTEAEMPLVFERNAGKASQLKEGFKQLLDAEGQYTLAIKSTQPAFNGKFTVTRAGLKKGRGGQVVLELQKVGSTDTIQLWSYRHASVISKVSILTEGEPAEDIFGE